MCQDSQSIGAALAGTALSTLTAPTGPPPASRPIRVTILAKVCHVAHPGRRCARQFVAPPPPRRRAALGNAKGDCPFVPERHSCALGNPLSVAPAALKTSATLRRLARARPEARNGRRSKPGHGHCQAAGDGKGPRRCHPQAHGDFASHVERSDRVSPGEGSSRPDSMGRPKQDPAWEDGQRRFHGDEGQDDLAQTPEP